MKPAVEANGQMQESVQNLIPLDPLEVGPWQHRDPWSRSSANSSGPANHVGSIVQQVSEKLKDLKVASLTKEEAAAVELRVPE